jgi:hypothetical protein
MAAGDVRQQGTRIYYAPIGSTWTALAAGAAAASPWVQVIGGVNTKVVPHEVEKFDPSPLEATTPSTEVVLKPGNMQFTCDKEGVQSVTLRGFCTAGTRKMWAFLYLDGCADLGTGKLTCQSSDAAKGDFKTRVQDQFTVNCEGTVELQAHA